MAGIRNGVLGRITLNTAAWTLVFQVPANRTVLLKNILIFSEAASAANVAVRVQAADLSAYVDPVGETMQLGDSFEWSGWMALNPTDLLYVTTTAVPVRFWLSGAVLPGSSEDIPLPSQVELGPGAEPPWLNQQPPMGVATRVGSATD